MKYLYLVLAIIAIGLIAFNTTHIDASNPFEGESLIAVISIMAGLCALMLLAILYVSKKIVEKGKEKNKSEDSI